jgi:hypothetical protein
MLYKVASCWLYLKEYINYARYDERQTCTQLLCVTILQAEWLVHSVTKEACVVNMTLSIQVLDKCNISGSKISQGNIVRRLRSRRETDFAPESFR